MVGLGGDGSRGRGVGGGKWDGRCYCSSAHQRCSSLCSVSALFLSSLSAIIFSKARSLSCCNLRGWGRGRGKRWGRGWSKAVEGRTEAVKSGTKSLATSVHVN